MTVSKWERGVLSPTPYQALLMGQAQRTVRLQKDKAAEQQALFVTKKFDPGAPTYSLDFLRKHPEISTESVPWHMHTDEMHDMSEPVSGGAQ